MKMSGMEGETCFLSRWLSRYRQPYYSSSDDGAGNQESKRYGYRVQAPEGIRVKIRKWVTFRPLIPAYGEYDSDYLTTEPGLYPIRWKRWRDDPADPVLPGDASGSILENSDRDLREKWNGRITAGDVAGRDRQRAAVEIHVVPVETCPHWI